ALPLISRVSAVLLANKKDRSVETTEMSFFKCYLVELAFVLVRSYQGFQLFLTELPFAVVRLYQGFQPFY
ncbi:hypothetical protein ACFC4I_14395, partial [Enterococcus durans]|uniref:hypothetical protein n=1 Tax=Enterococcus durans TaxID=53345 RepID=UPI0035DCBF05